MSLWFSTALSETAFVKITRTSRIPGSTYMYTSTWITASYTAAKRHRHRFERWKLLLFGFAGQYTAVQSQKAVSAYFTSEQVSRYCFLVLWDSTVETKTGCETVRWQKPQFSSHTRIIDILIFHYFWGIEAANFPIISVWSCDESGVLDIKSITMATEDTPPPGVCLIVLHLELGIFVPIPTPKWVSITWYFKKHQCNN